MEHTQSQIAIFTDFVESDNQPAISSNAYLLVLTLKAQIVTQALNDSHHLDCHVIPNPYTLNQVILDSLRGRLSNASAGVVSSDSMATESLSSHISVARRLDRRCLVQTPNQRFPCLLRGGWIQGVWEACSCHCLHRHGSHGKSGTTDAFALHLQSTLSPPAI